MERASGSSRLSWNEAERRLRKEAQRSQRRWVEGLVHDAATDKAETPPRQQRGRASSTGAPASAPDSQETDGGAPAAHAKRPSKIRRLSRLMGLGRGSRRSSESQSAPSEEGEAPPAEDGGKSKAYSI